MGEVYECECGEHVWQIVDTGTIECVSCGRTYRVKYVGAPAAFNTMRENLRIAGPEPTPDSVDSASSAEHDDAIQMGS